MKMWCKTRLVFVNYPHNLHTMAFSLPPLDPLLDAAAWQQQMVNDRIHFNSNPFATKVAAEELLQRMEHGAGVYFKEYMRIKEDMAEKNRKVDTHNKTLVASAKQLEASKQKLEADNKKLRAANKKLEAANKTLEATQPIECTGCASTLMPNQAIIPQCCKSGMAFCGSCAETMWKADGALCPNPPCRKVMCPGTWARKMPTPSAAWRIAMKTCTHDRAVVKSAMLEFACPTPDCVATVVYRKGSKLRFHPCAKCEAIACSTCRTSLSEHALDATCACPQAAEDAAAERSAKDAGAKRCPSCRVITFKADGCNTMTCGSCGYYYCWLMWHRHGQAHHTAQLLAGACTLPR